MTVIRVPKTPASAMNPDRPISGLLKNQIEHLQHAEFRLPIRDQTNIYINKIKTEGEAAEYIRQVTAMLHREQSGERESRSRIPTARAKSKSSRRHNKKTTTARTKSRRQPPGKRK